MCVEKLCLCPYHGNGFLETFRRTPKSFEWKVGWLYRTQLNRQGHRKVVREFFKFNFPIKMTFWGENLSCNIVDFSSKSVARKTSSLRKRKASNLTIITFVCIWQHYSSDRKYVSAIKKSIFVELHIMHFI